MTRDVQGSRAGRVLRLCDPRFLTDQDGNGQSLTVGFPFGLFLQTLLMMDFEAYGT
jgi:hypothetical protein